ncbi:MAG TPA: hypothetical protein VFC99_04550, partial [Acidimicrobiia bacterium]|nr:hypothetical protein [Acidimicrobiia bacterium]
MGGLILAIVLVVAGSLLTWGYKFADDNVHDRLTAQEIFFPTNGSDALAPNEIGPYLTQHAGLQLTTGEQAEAPTRSTRRTRRGWSRLPSEPIGSPRGRANPSDPVLGADRACAPVAPVPP